MRESERGKRDQNISFPRSKVRKHYQQNLLLLLEKKTPVFNSPFQIPDSRPKENEKISPLCSLSLSLPFHPRARSRCASSRRRRGWQRRDATATRRKKRCIPRAHVALAFFLPVFRVSFSSVPGYRVEGISLTSFVTANCLSFLP